MSDVHALRSDRSVIYCFYCHLLEPDLYSTGRTVQADLLVAASDRKLLPRRERALDLGLPRETPHVAVGGSVPHRATLSDVPQLDCRVRTTVVS